MRRGALRTPLVLERRKDPNATDSDGQPVNDWIPVRRVRAHIQDTAGEEVIAGDRVAVLQPATITVPFMADLHEGMRFKREDKDPRRPTAYYEIKTIRDPDNRGRWMKIEAVKTTTEAHAQ